MGTEQAMREAIEAAYRAFSGAVCPVHLEASPERDASRLGELISQPLRRLSGDVVGPYAGWAMTSVGSAKDYRYFLPRILELAVCGGGWVGTEPPGIANKIRMAQWVSWSAEERDAVEAVFLAAFRWTVHWPVEFTDEAPMWLCGLALLDVPVTPLLAEWRKATSKEAILQLVQFFLAVEDDLKRDRLHDAWWEDVPGPAACEIAAWLAHDDTKLQLMTWRDRVLPDDRWMFENALFFWPGA